MSQPLCSKPDPLHEILVIYAKKQLHQVMPQNETKVPLPMSSA